MGYKRSFCFFLLCLATPPAKQAIRKQVFFQERAKLMDKDSLEDAETSLQNMLRDFVNDKQNEVPEELR